MFTGIITHSGQVAAIAEIAGGRRLEIATDMPLDAVPLGASVAHSGVCLTVTEKCASGYRVDVSPETLERTSITSWREGTRINLEASLRLGDELGGHLVFGHVDAIGRIGAISAEGDYTRLEIAMPPDLAPLVAVKGSIAVDGISLTVNEADTEQFAVMIIPHTWQVTTLRHLSPGAPVNLEADMLARYVARQLSFKETA